MISYLKGQVIFKGKDFLILNVSGVGYKVSVFESSLAQADKGETRELFCFSHLKRDTIELYGFLDFKQLELFETLRAISGIGPKTAQTLASLGSIERLKKGIEGRDEEFLEKAKGIGRKKLQRISLELTGKFKDIQKPGKQKGKIDDALEGLLGLGFSQKEAKKALKRVSPKIKGSKERVGEALRILGR